MLHWDALIYACAVDDAGWDAVHARLIHVGPDEADGQALATLRVSASDVANAVTPRDDTERRLLEIAEAALGRGGFGVLDCFGDLGGHSLTAARICAQVGAEFGALLTPIDVLTGSTVADLARIVTQRAGGTPIPQPVRRPRSEYPASVAQREFWMIRELGGANATVVAMHFRLTGVSDLGIVQRALDSVVAQHEVLRCHYGLDLDGQLRARVMSPGQVELAEVPAEQLATQTRQTVERPFDLSGVEPAMRAIAARVGDGVDLIVTTDHLVFDGWSIGALMRDLATGIAALQRGEPPAPDEERLQVSDISQHEQLLFAARAAQNAEYWRAALQGATSLHDLPGTPAGVPGVGQCRITLPVGLGTSVTRLATQIQVTPFAIYLAALAVLVKGLTGRTDQLLSAPFARRGDAASHDLIGPLLGMLPIRVEAASTRPFAELADEVARATAAGLGHTDLLFEDMLAPVTRMPGTPALAVMLSLQPASVPAATRVDDTRIALAAPVRGGGNPDVLSFLINDTTGGLCLTVEYPRARFGQADAEAFADRMRRVLDAVVSDPHQAVGAIGLLSDEESGVIRQWGDVPAREPALSLVASVLSQAETNPSETAVSGPDGDLSYAELEEFSDRVAGALHAAGLRPGEIVAVCLPRVRLLPAVMFGVLRAGGAFLPLDPEHPVDRLAYQIGDCESRLMLVDDSVAPITQAISAQHAGLRALNIGQLAPGQAPEILPSQDATCYVLYTSGSTGRPKGVEVSHRGLGVNLAAMRDVMRVVAGDVVMTLSPISFDVGHLGIWLPLAVGARCVLVDQARAVDGHALAGFLTETGVTVLVGPPTGLRLLMAGGWAGKPDLRVMSAGEALDPALARAVVNLVGELWNGYGPTEATIITTMHLVEGSEEQSVPIGSPLPGYRVYVMDESGRQTPLGVIGELWIAGPAVSRRYLNRPEATAQAFGADPHHPDEPLYRTGDLVRWMPNGQIDFIGRRDHQVKVRGHRVELGEVESVLREHPLVADTVVTVAQPAGEATLVGYVVWREQPDVPAAQAFLASTLPSYMVPRLWVSLPALPRNSSGKVDRAALPEPDGAERSRVPPRTAMQEFVAGVWAEVLGSDQVYADDDFFALGGHSFAATRAIGRLRDLLDVDISVRLLFDHSVLERFAHALEQLLLDEPRAAT